MVLGDSILLAIVDKLLIGVVVLIAGLWLNERLEKLKGQIALETALAQVRAGALGRLWNLSAPLTPRGKVPTGTDCKAAFNDLRKWYYAESGAMHLTFAATDAFLQLLDALEEEQCALAKDLASALRTQLKIDLGLYTKSQARRQLPTTKNKRR